MGTRLFPSSSNKITQSLGKVRVQVRGCDSEAKLTLAGRKVAVRRCRRKVVVRAQPASLLHWLSQISIQLARRQWRVVSRTISSLRAHDSVSDWSDAEKSCEHASCGSRGRFGRKGARGGFGEPFDQDWLCVELAKEQVDRLRRARSFVGKVQQDELERKKKRWMRNWRREWSQKGKNRWM